MTNTQRLWIGFGALIAVQVATLLGVGVWLHALQSSLMDMTERTAPARAAAYEMEIIANGIGQSTWEYLYTGQPDARLEAVGSAQRFERSKAEYETRMAAPHAQNSLDSVAVLFSEVRTLSTQLMDQKARQRPIPAAALDRFAALNADLIQTLDTQLMAVKQQMVTANKRTQAAAQTLITAVLFLAILTPLLVVTISIGIGRSVSRTERQLQQSTVELSELDRRKNEFLALLAHELRNPLAPISNAVQLLILTSSNSKLQSSTVEMMERQIAHMIRLVDDLLDVSRISRGMIELRKEPIVLAVVVNHALEIALPRCEAQSLALDVQQPDQPLVINGDPVRLAQVLGNLLHNACKFTSPGGRIRLLIEREGDEAVIRVQDNGVGIAANQLEPIFELFVQSDSSLERVHGGLGIGLALVKSLTEMHGGRVQATSAGLGHGSEFIVRLPLSTESAQPVPEPAPVQKAVTSNTARRILVVDDNHASAQSLAQMLKLAGHDVHTAYDGLEAVEAATAIRPGVILLDIGLPKLNGYEAARRIREQPGGDKLTLIALTGWAQDTDKQRARESGFDHHLVKPLRHADLNALLAQLP